MSQKSYLEIQEYQKNKKITPQIKIERDLFNDRLVEKYVKQLSKIQLEKFSQERGIPIEVLKEHQIGWDGYAYTLPIYHQEGFLIGFRRKIPDGDTISKKGSRAGLFNVDTIMASSAGTTIYICEGEWDAMMLETQGYVHVVAVPGAFTFKKEWLSLFKNRHVVLLYDTDETGRKQAEKIAVILKNHALTVKNVDLSAILKEGKDVRDYFTAR